MSKISFGFSKKKSTPTFCRKENAKASTVEYITSIENQEIQSEKKNELTIPVAADNTVAEKIRSHRVRSAIAGTTSAPKRPNFLNGDDNSLEAMAIRELLNEANEQPEKSMTVPMSAEAAIEDNESNLDDYEQVPVEEYGTALLRGMGWSAGAGIGKRQKVIEIEERQLRPRSLGLGANPLKSDHPS